MVLEARLLDEENKSRRVGTPRVGAAPVLARIRDRHFMTIGPRIRQDARPAVEEDDIAPLHAASFRDSEAYPPRVLRVHLQPEHTGRRVYGPLNPDPRG